MRRARSSTAPVCWWCGDRTADETGRRGSAPELGLPAGSGVVVCSPGCPARPAGARVWAASIARSRRGSDVINGLEVAI